MKLRLPLQGVSDVVPSSDQPGSTTRDMLNMRGEDCVTRQFRLSVREGLRKYISTQVNGSAPVRALKTVTFQRKQITYTDKTSGATSPLGTADVSHSAQTASKREVTANDTDRNGNLYSTDGTAGVEKRNSTLELQWKLALPVRSEAAICRALRVATVVGLQDADTEMVFAGVSEGGLQEDALLWGYKQVTSKDKDGNVETKTEQVFEIETSAYVERIKERNGLLYTAQNEPDTGRAFVRVYQNLTDATPDIALFFEVPYPVYDIDVNRKSGAIITAHPPNATRGKNPQLPDYVARDLGSEWIAPRDLTSKDSRVWFDLDADRLKEVFPDLKEGDALPNVPDFGPGFRDLFQAGGLTTQPTYTENGICGKPAIRFNGQTAGTSNVLYSQANTAYQPPYADQQKTITPAFDNCKWVMFIVMRAPGTVGSTTADVFSQDNQAPAGSNTNDARLIVNKSSNSEDPTGGTNLEQGKVLWDVTTVDVTGEGLGLGTGGGVRSIPLAGDSVYSGSTGTQLITICSDGRNNASTDAAQHSFIRVNGRPIDRWLSANQAGLAASTLGGSTFGAGISYLQGDIARILVLRDYSDGGAHGDPATGNLDGAGTSHYPRAIGTFGSAAKAWAANATNRYNDNEIERVEGYLAWKYGFAHVLPCGTGSVLDFSAIPNAGDTVTIDGVVYTFVAAATLAAAPTTARNVSTGPTPNCREAAWNLFRAINCTGAPGTDYGSLTTPHATCRATFMNDAAAGTAHIKVETKGLSAVAVAESTATARMSWTNATTSTVGTVTTSAVLAVPGHYPHPFGVFYGPPRKDSGATVGAAIESLGLLLASHEGILARWDPQGKIAWVLTSRLSLAQPGGFSLPASDIKHGGIGYACQFGEGEDNAIYSAGPQYAAASGTEGAVIRRVIDNTTSVDVTGTGTWNKTIVELIGAGTELSMSNTHLKIDVDTFDNVYLPYYEPTPANGISSLAAVSAAGTVFATWRKSNTATNPAGLCVTVDRKLPEYDGDPATRAFAVFLGTRMGYTTDSVQDNIYKIELVAVTHVQGVPPSETRLVAVANGSVRTSLSGGTFQDPSGSGTLTNPVFTTDASNPDAFISMASLGGEVFITDGRTIVVYNARRDTLTAMEAKIGELKPRARCVAAWRNRLVWFRFADSPTNFLMSAFDDPYDYDLGANPPTQTMAVQGDVTPFGTGQCPDIINDFIPLSDDTAGLLCESSVYRLDGDPADNGRFTLISDATGGVFGGGWCKDENGALYFMGRRGCVYRLDGRGLTALSEEAIPTRLRSIDYTTTRVKLCWNPDSQGVHVLMTPVDARATPTGDASIREHYFWSRKLKGWYPDSINSIDMQPTATFVGDGDVATSRHTVVGCMDGYVRCFDPAENDDDGERILSHALVGPLLPDEIEYESRFGPLRAVLSTAQGGCGYSLFASDTPDDLGDPIVSGFLDPGRNPAHFVKARGSYVAIKVSNSTHDRFAIESLSMDVVSTGKEKAPL